MTDGQLLIPAPQAAKTLGISRRSLRNRIDSGLIRSVKVGPRVYVHKTELQRIVNGAPKPEAPEEISANEKSAEGVCQNGHTPIFMECQGKKIEECDELPCICDWINTARQKTR